MERQKGGIAPSAAQYHPTRKMLAATYQGKKNVVVKEVPVPIVTDPTDVVVKVTASTVCGSDLHLYHGDIPALKHGDILGHESVGIVESVGPSVTSLKVGDRVIISAVISCGFCDYCKRGEWSCCDTTNINPGQEKLYGHHTGALFGYSHTVGGYDGCQAEYVRVPYGDVNCFKIPDKVPDKNALLVADILCTGYHGTFLADVKPGDKVVVFGCGPVGLVAQMWAKHRGAQQIIAIDVDQQRLNFAKEHFGVITINGDDTDPVKAAQELTLGGPDKVIDCVGFRFPKNLLHKVERALHLETDAPNIVNAAIKMVRKNGHITLIGDYVGYANHFNIGAFMEKHLTMNGGQLWPQRHHKFILEALEKGEVDPSFLVTHTFPFSQIGEVYDKFDKHEDGIIKPLVLPDELFAQTLTTTVTVQPVVVTTVTTTTV